MTTTKTTITILHETAKALIITDNVNVSWIMRKQLRSDNTLTAGAITALKNSKTTYDQYVKDIAEKAARDEARKHNVEVVDYLEYDNVIYRTEKAVLFCVKENKFWIPKALINNNRAYYNLSLPANFEIKNADTKEVKLAKDFFNDLGIATTSKFEQEKEAAEAEEAAKDEPIKSINKLNKKHVISETDTEIMFGYDDCEFSINKKYITENKITDNFTAFKIIMPKNEKIEGDDAESFMHYIRILTTDE